MSNDETLILGIGNTLLTDEGAGIHAAAFGADSTNFILAAEVLLRAKTHGAAAS